MIEGALLSGLYVRHIQKPLAGMVIRGSGPNLLPELQARRDRLVSLTQIYSIVVPIQVVALSHPPLYRLGLLRRDTHIAAAIAGSL